ncbi:hypothetical protein HGM15179_009886 [Zosterops borbonicus]|uniref:Uncharacterized protein n=1 Tax=Zosterops borbonicus TaxID=364589 RepID=A0A8K1LKR7_9PASS|nr:hypothetical protein HGM15179_009886 [Zosterops borbonicus]
MASMSRKGSAPLFSSPETLSDVLHPDLGTPILEVQVPVGVSSEEGHEDDQRLENFSCEDRQSLFSLKKRSVGSGETL